MLKTRHYYCSNCNYHGDQELQITNKSEILLNPSCPVCNQNEFYYNILDYKLKDDDSEVEILKINKFLKQINYHSLK